MGRKREVSSTGLYHVITRGVGHMILFETDSDRRYYLKILKKYRDELGVRVFAWILMDNHVHLIVDVGEGNLPTALMRRIDVAYSKYFNSKTGHVGHVFQGDYGSIPISCDEQLMATVDYIHRNPERALISSMESYRWSSFQEYAGKLYVVDTSLVLALFGSVENMLVFHARSEDVVRIGQSMSDDEVLALALELGGVSVSGELRGLARKRRNDLICRLNAKGIRGSQMSRVLSVGEATISRVLKEMEETAPS